MEILVTLFDLVFLVAFIVAIVYGIRWFTGRKDKENESLKKNKKYFWISLIVMIISLLIAGMAQGSIDETQEQQATEQQEKNKSNYKDDKEDFIDQYGTLGSKVEDLSKQEGKEWSDAIDNSDDFDVESAVDTIQSNHTDEIDEIDSKVSDLHDLDQKIQKNDSVKKSDKETIHKSYLDLKHFANHATNISGSYNDFTDEHNELDQKTADHMEELQDL